MWQTDTINILFERQAERTPGNIAVRHAGTGMSYGELNTLANRMAHCLLSHGVRPETFTGIVADHSPQMIAAILGVIKSGAAYVAAEPDFPRERIAFMLEETRAGVVFTERKYAEVLPGWIKPVFIDDDFHEFPGHNPSPDITDTNVLYALYTSGTTGAPKGVVIEHRNVANYVRAFTGEFGMNETDKMLQCSVCTFDIFVEELYPVLLCGGTLVVASRRERSNARLLAGLMECEKVTVVSGFPYLLQELDKIGIPSALRVAISGGDVLRGEYVENLIKKVPVYNTYGPSETTVCATYYRYTGETTSRGSVPIGCAIAGVGVCILDEKLQPVKQGHKGEICITGAGVGRGYLHRPVETSRAFIERDGARMYLTGDMGVELPDGNIDFISRKDRQVMIWGKRVEPSEVESVMSRLDGVDMAAVKSFPDTEGNNRLAAYYAGAKTIGGHRWREYLGKYLPEYMIPEYFIRLEAMPRTTNGKIDLKRLPEAVPAENL